MYPALLADLEKAEKSIFLEFFIVSQGKMWQGVEDICGAKRHKVTCGRSTTTSAACLVWPSDFVVRMERAHIRCIPLT